MLIDPVEIHDLAALRDFKVIALDGRKSIRKRTEGITAPAQELLTISHESVKGKGDQAERLRTLIRIDRQNTYNDVLQSASAYIVLDNPVVAGYSDESVCLSRLACLLGGTLINLDSKVLSIVGGEI